MRASSVILAMPAATASFNAAEWLVNGFPVGAHRRRAWLQTGNAGPNHPPACAPGATLRNGNKAAVPASPFRRGAAAPRGEETHATQSRPPAPAPRSPGGPLNDCPIATRRTTPASLPGRKTTGNGGAYG